MARLTLLVVGITCASAGWLACSLDFGSGPRDGGTTSQGIDGGVDAEAGADAQPSDLSPLGDTARWELLDLRTVPIVGLGTKDQATFGATAFDGTYLYLLPSTPYRGVLRFDTRGSFTTLASWSGLQLGRAFNVGAAAVCERLYIASQDEDAVGEYTLGSTFEGASFTFFDIPAATADTPGGFAGATCAIGRVFLASARSGQSAAHETTLSLPTKWTRGPAGPFRGAVRFAPPTAKESKLLFGPAALLNTSAFKSESDWETGSLDLATVGITPPAAFDGAVYDGRHVYLASANATAQTFARFDADADVRAMASWSVSPSFDGAAMRGAVFDGRYVYFGPSSGTKIVRYDTQAAFSGEGARASFTSFDASQLFDGGAPVFSRIAFDGKHVYLVPSTGGIIARYRTDGAGMPPSYAGSFY